MLLTRLSQWKRYHRDRRNRLAKGVVVALLAVSFTLLTQHSRGAFFAVVLNVLPLATETSENESSGDSDSKETEREESVLASSSLRTCRRSGNVSWRHCTILSETSVAVNRAASSRWIPSSLLVTVSGRLRC